MFAVPDSVKFLLNRRSDRSRSDEAFDDLEFVRRACLKPARVVEYERRIRCKHQLIFDVVQSALMIRRHKVVIESRPRNLTPAVGERIEELVRNLSRRYPP